METMLSFEKLKSCTGWSRSSWQHIGHDIFWRFLFPGDFFLIRKFLKWQGAYLDKIGTWIETVSEIDALVSMATFRYNNPDARHAEIIEADESGWRQAADCIILSSWVEAEQWFHYQEWQIAYITGKSEHGGQEHVSRVLSVNYILAMNGMPVFADSLRVSRFSLFSSMRTTDDLTHGISYFNAELLRLKQLINHCTSHSHTLIILDEILKGTNSLWTSSMVLVSSCRPFPKCRWAVLSPPTTWSYQKWPPNIQTAQ